MYHYLVQDVSQAPVQVLSRLVGGELGEDDLVHAVLPCNLLQERDHVGGQALALEAGLHHDLIDVPEQWGKDNGMSQQVPSAGFPGSRHPANRKHDAGCRLLIARLNHASTALTAQAPHGTRAQSGS
jgi:hypothetical protein